MYRQEYITQAEIERLVNESSDEDETATLIRNANSVDLVMLPPDRVDELSDIEDIDENELILSDPSAIMPGEVAGSIEVVCDFNDCNTNKPDRADDDDVAHVADDYGNKPAKRPKKDTKKKAFPAKWSKSKEFSFSRQPVDVERDKIVELFEKYGMYLYLFIVCLFHHMLTFLD